MKNRSRLIVTVVLIFAVTFAVTGLPANAQSLDDLIGQICPQLPAVEKTPEKLPEEPPAEPWTNEELTEKVWKLGNQYNDLKLENDKLKEEIATLTKKIEDFTKNLGKLTEKVEDLTEKVEDLTEKVDELSEK